MTATYEEARDDILKLFKDAWDAAVLANPTTIAPIADVIFDDISQKPTDGELAWARVALRHDRGAQGSLADDVGNTRWDRFGTLFVQIFTVVGEGLVLSYQIAKILSDAYEGKTTPLAVWFRNVSIREIGPDGEWFQVNWSVDFEYEEVK